MKGLRTGILATVAVALVVLLWSEHNAKRVLEAEVAAFRQQKTEFSEIRAAHDRLARSAAEASEEILRLRAEIAALKAAGEKTAAGR